MIKSRKTEVNIYAFGIAGFLFVDSVLVGWELLSRRATIASTSIQATKRTSVEEVDRWIKSCVVASWSLHSPTWPVFGKVWHHYPMSNRIIIHSSRR